MKIDLSFLKAYDKIWASWDSFSIFLIFLTHFHFQGSHIWADLAIYKHMATLKMKSDLILLLGKLKNLWIWILFFRVAKFWWSGLPYLAWTELPKLNSSTGWWTNYQLKTPHCRNPWEVLLYLFHYIKLDCEPDVFLNADWNMLLKKQTAFPGTFHSLLSTKKFLYVYPTTPIKMS